MTFRKNFLHTENLTKYSSKIVLILTIIFYACLTIWNIRAYSETQNTIKVVMLKGPLVRNQLITVDNIQKYDMTEKEFYRYALEKGNSGITNKLIKWDDRGVLFRSDKPCYSAYSKKNRDLLMFDDVITTYIDNSRLFLYNYPGKEIIEMSVTGSNLNTFKKILKVGDKINIDCSYKKTLTSAVVKSSIKRKITSDTYFDYDFNLTDSVFQGIEIADILNSNGDSILDYETYISSLGAQEQIELRKSEDYLQNTKASTLLLAVTPSEKRLYNTYRKKDGATFFISMPEGD